MSKLIDSPSLSRGNRVYLYRLLRDALGCGKQTFITQVEEALAEGDMAATDLGFETTRELLEALGDCVKLTVFKGGRIYATVVANEAWDAALAKPEEPKGKDASKKARSRKKKKGDKTIKAVKPKHVKRPEPEPVVEESVPEAVPETVEDAAEETTAEIPVEAEAQPSEPAETPRNDAIFSLEDEDEEAAANADTEDAAENDTPEAAPAVPEPPHPAISLTVVYDPENANAGVQTWESNPAAGEAAAKAEAVAEAEKSKPEANEPEQGQVEAATEAPNLQDETVADPAPQTEPCTEDKTDFVAPQAVKSAAGTKSEPASKSDAAAELDQETEPAAESEPASAVEPAADSKSSAASAAQSATAAVSRPAAEPKSAAASTAKPTAKSQQASTPAPTPEPQIPADYPVDFALEVFCPGQLLSELAALLPYGADALGIVGEYYWIARERGAIQAGRNRASFTLRYTKGGERHEATVRIRRNTTGGMGATWAIDQVTTA